MARSVYEVWEPYLPVEDWTAPGRYVNGMSYCGFCGQKWRGAKGGTVKAWNGQYRHYYQTMCCHKLVSYERPYR